MLKNFEKSAIEESMRELYESYVDNEVDVNAQVVDEWLNKQPPSVRKNACSDVPLHLRPFSRYSYMIKPVVKPILETSGAFKYSSVQTIAYYEKYLNVIFRPIFNILSERLYAVLKKKF